MFEILEHLLYDLVVTFHDFFGYRHLSCLQVRCIHVQWTTGHLAQFYLNVLQDIDHSFLQYHRLNGKLFDFV